MLPETFDEDWTQSMYRRTQNNTLWPMDRISYCAFQCSEIALNIMKLTDILRSSKTYNQQNRVRIIFIICLKDHIKEFHRIIVIITENF